MDATSASPIADDIGPSVRRPCAGSRSDPAGSRHRRLGGRRSTRCARSLPWSAPGWCLTRAVRVRLVGPAYPFAQAGATSRRARMASRPCVLRRRRRRRPTPRLVDHSADPARRAHRRHHLIPRPRSLRALRAARLTALTQHETRPRTAPAGRCRDATTWSGPRRRDVRTLHQGPWSVEAEGEMVSEVPGSCGAQGCQAVRRRAARGGQVDVSGMPGRPEYGRSLLCRPLSIHPSAGSANRRAWFPYLRRRHSVRRSRAGSAPSSRHSRTRRPSCAGSSPVRDRPGCQSQAAFPPTGAAGGLGAARWPGWQLFNRSRYLNQVGSRKGHA